VNRSTKKNGGFTDEVSFFDVAIFGKIAEGLKPYLVKGTQIAVQGSLRQDRWEKGGQKFSRIYISADSVQLLGGRKEGSDPRNDSEAARNQHGSSGEEYPEDIPF
jgi:single-strand DNA-binding protein